jgi:formylmethanofuran dehydrogenase subunit E
MKTKFVPPEWAFEFHGHRCPFMPLGYRMGMLAMERLGVEREKDHGFFVFSEMGEGHPQGCLMDGMQAATGGTYGKGLMAKTFYGKLAATFYHPQKGAVRFSLTPAFLDALGKFEFFALRKGGAQPSGIPTAVGDEVIDWIAEQPDDSIFKIEDKPEFTFTPVKGSFSKTLCTECGEYVFDRFVRMRDGKPVCIPCSGYQKTVQKESGA